MLLRAAAEHGMDLTESVMIGDSDIDVVAGKAAGMATILLRPGGGTSADADIVVDDLAAAVGLIVAARTAH
jgi:D-glycero-D-manno-heptose 1,7-bisphosphate phosphatase